MRSIILGKHIGVEPVCLDVGFEAGKLQKYARFEGILPHNPLKKIMPVA